MGETFIALFVCAIRVSFVHFIERELRCIRNSGNVNTQKQEAERMKEIYQSSVKEVLGQMGSREEGLTIKEVEKSREKMWME